MSKFKIAAIVFGCALSLGVQAKEYVGFNLCSNINIQNIKDIARQHKTSNVSKFLRNWSVNDIVVIVEQYSIGNEFYDLDLQLYKGKLAVIGIKSPGKLLDYITAKYGDNYAKISEEYDGVVSSRNYFYDIKEDPSAQVVFTVNKIGETGSPYYYLAYHCTDINTQYQADKDAFKKEADKNKANDLGL